MKRLIAMAAALALLPAFALALSGEKRTCGDFSYIILEDGTAEIAGYSGTGGDVDIPAEVDGLAVTRIGNKAFYEREDLTGKLTIPEGVTRIGDAAFYSCMFSGELRLPDSLEVISQGAFGSCPFFTGTLKIPAGVKEIGEDAFRYCIGFTGRAAVPAGAVRIGEGAFAGCRGLTAFSVAKGNTAYKAVGGILFTADGEVLLCAPIGKKLNDYAVPAGVKRIGKSAFLECVTLTGITFPDSVVQIGDYAFHLCVGLTGELTLPSGLESIGNVVFNSCPGLKGKLTIPSGVTSIGWGAFADCTGFSGEVVIPDGVTFIDSYAFLDCTGITSVTVPDSVARIGEYALGFKISGDGYLPVSRFFLRCGEGSAAAAYAAENGIAVK